MEVTSQHNELLTLFTNISTTTKNTKDTINAGRIKIITSLNMSCTITTSTSGIPNHKIRSNINTIMNISRSIETTITMSSIIIDSGSTTIGIPKSLCVFIFVFYCFCHASWGHQYQKDTQTSQIVKFFVFLFVVA